MANSSATVVSQPFDVNGIVSESFDDINRLSQKALPPLSPWDKVSIGNFTFYATVTGRVSSKIDKKHRMGAPGATLTYNGTRAEDITITCFLFTLADEANCQNCVNQAFALAAQNLAMDVQHPGLAFFNTGHGPLHQLALVSATIPTPPMGGEPGHCVLRFEQWIAPSKAKPTANTVGASASLPSGIISVSYDPNQNFGVPLGLNPLNAPPGSSVLPVGTLSGGELPTVPGGLSLLPASPSTPTYNITIQYPPAGPITGP